MDIICPARAYAGVEPGRKCARLHVSKMTGAYEVTSPAILACGRRGKVTICIKYAL